LAKIAVDEAELEGEMVRGAQSLGGFSHHPGWTMKVIGWRVDGSSIDYVGFTNDGRIVQAFQQAFCLSSNQGQTHIRLSV